MNPTSQNGEFAVSVASTDTSSTIAQVQNVGSSLSFTGLASLSLVIVGWFIIYRNAKRLATRAETKSILDSALSELASIESMAVEYWLAGRQKRIESDEFILLISSKLLTFHSRLQLLHGRKVNIQGVDLGDLSTLITIDCEEVDRMQPEAKRERVQEILDSANAVHNELYDEFHTIYKPSFKIFSKDGCRW
nr:hypothetical protein [uncultured Vibrio sp.]